MNNMGGPSTGGMVFLCVCAVIGLVSGITGIVIGVTYFINHLTWVP